MAHKSMAPEGQEEFELIPAGAHIAMCYLVAYIGYHDTPGFQGKPPSVKPKMVFGWELVNEKDKEGKPFKIHGFYVDSLHEKAGMRKMLECWRTKKFTDEELRGFETIKVLSQPCIVTVVHKKQGEDTKARVESVTKLPKGSQQPVMSSIPIYFSVEPDDPDSMSLEMLPEWLRKTVQAAKAPPGGKHAAPPPPPKGEEEEDDDIPF